MKQKEEINIGPLVEWAVWGHLDSKKDLELILLKGHLLLETVLETVLDKCKIPDSSTYSFYQKARALKNVKFCNSELQNTVIKALFSLNILRNRLAHEWNFNANNGDLEAWGSSILEELKGTKYSRYTFRTRIVHAFSILSLNLLELSREDKPKIQ